MARVSQCVSEWYEDNYGWRSPHVSIERHFRNLFTWAFEYRPIYFITVEDRASLEKVEPVLKVYKTKEDAQDEFQVLSQLSAEFKRLGKDLGVPTPIAFIEGLPGLLMSRIRGKSLSEILWPPTNSSTDSAQALEAVKKAARWLAAYHNMSTLEDAKVLTGDTLLGDTFTNLNSSRAHKLDARVVQTLERWLHGVEDRVKKVKCPCVNSCDFNPNHIFISGSSVNVIDFEETSCSWPAEDLASFFAFCQAYKRTIRPMAVSPGELCETFLRTYASNITFGPLDQTVIEVGYIHELLETFLTPWFADGASLVQRNLSRLRSRSAKQELARRTSDEKWRTLIEAA